MKREKNMLKDQLRIKPLKIGFLKKDYIGNFNSNYEEYLTDFLNNSKFVKDNGNKKFYLIQKQENGEYDVTNDIYELDYKLLIDRKTTENLSYYSETIEVDSNGAICYGMSKKEGTWTRYHFLNILKGLSKQDFENIDCSKKETLSATKKLVKEYIDKILKNKNILYFIPYNVFFTDKNMNEKEMEIVVDILSDGLEGFINYRTSYIKDKDTFFCFISNNKIVFLKYDGILQLYDIVPTNVSEMYLKISDLSDNWSFES